MGNHARGVLGAWLNKVFFAELPSSSSQLYAKRLPQLRSVLCCRILSESLPPVSAYYCKVVNGTRLDDAFALSVADSEFASFGTNALSCSC